MSQIILVRGKSGTGKSTLSNELGRKLQVPILHKDDMYDSIAAYVSEHDLRNKICFDFLYRFLETTLSSKSQLILDFGFNRIDDVKRLKNWIEERGGELVLFHCICSNEPVWSERLAERRNNPLPNQLITDLAELKGHYQDIKTEYLEGEIILDTIVAKETLIDQIAAIIRKA